MKNSITFRGREVERQPMRLFVALGAVPMGLVGAVLGLAMTTVVVVLIPVWLVVDVVLRAIGRRGFCRYERLEDGSTMLHIGPDREGLRRVRRTPVTEV